MVGTPTADYTRYRQRSTPAKRTPKASRSIFSALIGIWAKNDASSGGGNQQLFNQAVLWYRVAGLAAFAVPIGNFRTPRAATS